MTSVERLGVRTATRRCDHDLRPGDVLVLYTDGLVEHRRTGREERLRVLCERLDALIDVAALVVQVAPR